MKGGDVENPMHAQKNKLKNNDNVHNNENNSSNVLNKIGTGTIISNDKKNRGNTHSSELEEIIVPAVKPILTLTHDVDENYDDDDDDIDNTDNNRQTSTTFSPLIIGMTNTNNNPSVPKYAPPPIPSFPPP